MPSSNSYTTLSLHTIDYHSYGKCNISMSHRFIEGIFSAALKISFCSFFLLFCCLSWLAHRTSVVLLFELVGSSYECCFVVWLIIRVLFCCLSWLAHHTSVVLLFELVGYHTSVVLLFELVGYHTSVVLLFELVGSSHECCFVVWVGWLITRVLFCCLSWLAHHTSVVLLFELVGSSHECCFVVWVGWLIIQVQSSL